MKAMNKQNVFRAELACHMFTLAFFKALWYMEDFQKALWLIENSV